MRLTLVLAMVTSSRCFSLLSRPSQCPRRGLSRFMAEEGPVPGRGPTSTRPLRPMTPRTDGPRWGEDYPSQRGQGRSSWTGGVSDDRSFRGEQRGGRNSPGGGRRSEGTRRYGDSEFRGQSRGSTSLRRRDEDEAPKPLARHTLINEDTWSVGIV